MRSAREERLLLAGAAGNLEVVVNAPASTPRGLALIAHPHPLYGGTLDNKVVQTLARSFTAQGQVAVRMNFRGVGASDGVYDEGRGETEDWLVVAAAMRARFPDVPVTLAGFSFGAFVQTRVAASLEHRRMVLVGPAVNRFSVDAVPAGTLVIHGEEDDVVPLAAVLDWARPQSLPIVVVPGTGHFFHGKLVELARIVNHSCAC
ncbi:MAG: alpha/beta hydrolase [Burkholderiales bacterium]|nr:alpha/beta hydrolase [Burkholderiales bacterium]